MQQDTATLLSTEAILVLTPEAVSAVRNFLNENPDIPPATASLRVAVRPGGCSGFKYDLSVVDAPEADDTVIEQDGVRLCVDPFSAQYLSGTTISYVTSLAGSGFAFSNPNSTGGCGCGSSFAA